MLIIKGYIPDEYRHEQTQDQGHCENSERRNPHRNQHPRKPLTVKFCQLLQHSSNNYHRNT
nr:MAG TPA: hypothetical protein [Caudoviricetes sp.]